jgi:dTDP-4-dehydrorhamnose reductase
VIFDGEQAPYDESAPPAPIHPYGEAKAEAEAEVQRLTPTAVIVRTSLICRLDPPDRTTSWIVDSLTHGLPVTLFTDEIRSPVWVSDLAAALLELAQNKYSGVINIAGPQALSRYTMGLHLAQCLGLDPTGIRAGRSADSGLARPRNCTLDVRLAQRLLRTRLRSYDEGLAP